LTSTSEIARSPSDRKNLAGERRKPIVIFCVISSATNADQDREIWRCTLTLFLVQHGEAKAETEDPERSLTDRGAEIVGLMAGWTARMGIRVDQIRHSGKRRAEQTATIFARQLHPPRGLLAVKGLNPNDDVALVTASLQADQESIMLVGHLPHLSRVVSLLVTGDPEIEVVRFRNAGIVCLTQKEGKWAVEWVMQPDLLGDAG
jgi:phosphohistidine phosphatase